MLLVIVFSLTSTTGYIYITKKISAGEQQLAAGAKQLENGQKLLAAGKKKLSAGKRKLSNAKKTMNYISLAGMAIAPPIGGIAYLGMDKTLSGKDRLVANGEARVRSGEKQIKEGEIKLQQGYAKLSFAKKIQFACALGAIFFAVLAVVLGVYWRRSSGKK